MKGRYLVAALFVALLLAGAAFLAFLAGWFPLGPPAAPEPLPEVAELEPSPTAFRVTPLATAEPPDSSRVTVAPAALPAPPADCEYAATLLRVRSATPEERVAPGERVYKTWRLRNTGTCPWLPGTTLVYRSGELAPLVDVLRVPTTEPGAEVEVGVAFIVPEEPGAYESLWQLVWPDGSALLRRFPAGVEVAEAEADDAPAEAAPAAPTATRPTATRVTRTPTVSPTPTAEAEPSPTPTDTPAPSPTPASTAEPVSGWRGEYFNNAFLQGPARVERTDPEIAFSWGTNSPFPELPTNQFSIRWTQSLAFESGHYRFRAQADDGLRFWLNDELVLDGWDAAPGTVFEVDRFMSPRMHDMRVEYHEDAQLAFVYFSWEQLDATDVWEAAFYDNPILGGSPVLTRQDPYLSFDWGASAPGPQLPADNFSARWTRRPYFAAGTYRFTVRVDDGVRLYVDDELVIDSWSDGPERVVTGEITLDAGPHRVRVDYYERILDALIQLSWERLPDN